MSFSSRLGQSLGRVLSQANGAESSSASLQALTVQEALATPAIGQDVSPTIAPDNGIVTVKVLDYPDSYQWQGSGVLLSPDEVLTASHVLYHPGYYGTKTVEVTAASVGSSAITATATTDGTHFFDIGNIFDDITPEESQSDYAIIHLATPVYGRTYFNLLANYPGGNATVSGYPGSAGGSLVAYTGAVTLDPSYTLLDGAAIGPGSSGGPLWITGTDGQSYVVGVVSSYNADDPTTGSNVQITSSVASQVESWMTQDGDAAPPLSVTDTSLNETYTPQATTYTGPVAGLDTQYLNISSDDLNFTASTANWFLHSGSGEDALQAYAGINVLDGGTGSNFLVGGSGTDTFFTDDRGATTDIWDTLVNFHAGDSATIFGVTPGDFAYHWVNGQGAEGYTGLTLHVTAPGHSDASVTLSGYLGTALGDGALSVSFGTTNGAPYLYIHANNNQMS